MKRPAALRLFDICYLAAIACGVASAALGWDQAASDFSRELARDGLAAPVRDSLIQAAAMVTGFTYALMLLAWAVTSFRRSRAGRWIIVVVAALSTFTLVVQLAKQVPDDTVGVLASLFTLLQLIALYLLFRPEVSRWLARSPAGSEAA